MVKFCAGVDKGDIAEGDVFNDAFRLGKVDEKYTSDRVVETVGADGKFTPAWTPIVKGAFDEKDAHGNVIKKNGDVKVIKKAGGEEFKEVEADGTISGLAEGDRVAYVYNNVVIPQNNLPLLVAKMDAIPLIAKARRIAIYYSQMAAFQAKTDYGMDLGAQLSEKAVGQLAYKLFVA